MYMRQALYTKYLILIRRQRAIIILLLKMTVSLVGVKSALKPPWAKNCLDSWKSK